MSWSSLYESMVYKRWLLGKGKQSWGIYLLCSSFCWVNEVYMFSLCSFLLYLLFFLLQTCCFFVQFLNVCDHNLPLTIVHCVMAWVWSGRGLICANFLLICFLFRELRPCFTSRCNNMAMFFSLIMHVFLPKIITGSDRDCNAVLQDTYIWPHITYSIET